MRLRQKKKKRWTEARCGGRDETWDTDTDRDSSDADICGDDFLEDAVISSLHLCIRIR